MPLSSASCRGYHLHRERCKLHTGGTSAVLMNSCLPYSVQAQDVGLQRSTVLGLVRTPARSSTETTLVRGETETVAAIERRFAAFAGVPQVRICADQCILSDIWLRPQATVQMLLLQANCSPISVLRYGPGDQFKLHYDHCPAAPRIWTAIMYLCVTPRSCILIFI